MTKQQIENQKKVYYHFYTLLKAWTINNDKLKYIFEHLKSMNPNEELSKEQIHNLNIFVKARVRDLQDVKNNYDNYIQEKKL